MTDEKATTPTVVTICGSMRFYRQMLDVAADLTLQGSIVLAPFAVVAPEDQGSETKTRLDELHFRKIDLCSVVVVVTDRDNYIGESTQREINYAFDHGKAVQFREVDR